MRRAVENSVRTCLVCGCRFEPTEAQKHYPKPVNTCPDCLAAGKKYQGKRGDRKPTVCAVCGATFERERKDQRRCPACIARKPAHAVDKQRSAARRES